MQIHSKKNWDEEKERKKKVRYLRDTLDTEDK